MPENSVPTRRLRDLQVSALGLGCMGMSFAYGPVDESESLATLHAAIDSGVTFLDTADMYGNGANERLLAQVLRARREQVQLATKFGIRTDPDTNEIAGVDGSPDYVARAVEGSLRRLQVDVIDLYYVHRVDPAVPIEDTVAAMAGLVEQGKVRHLGLSEASADTLRRACAIHPISAVQSEWSIFSRDIEATVVPAARELGVGVVAYSPLGRGMLTGAASAVNDLAADDFRRTLPRWQGDALATNVAMVRRLGELATLHDLTPSQLALGWLLAQGDDVVPIPGTKRRRYLTENIAAAQVQLTPEDLAELSALTAHGDRYPDMAWVAGHTATAGDQ